MQRSKVHASDKVMTRAADKRFHGWKAGRKGRFTYSSREVRLCRVQERGGCRLCHQDHEHDQEQFSRSFFCSVFFDIKVEGYEVKLGESNTTLYGFNIRQHMATRFCKDSATWSKTFQDEGFRIVTGAAAKMSPIQALPAPSIQLLLAWHDWLLTEREVGLAISKDT